MASIALFGAGGKMGLRLTEKLKQTSHVVRHVEVSDARSALLEQRGVKAVTPAEALDGVEIVILAVPDNSIGQVSAEIGPMLRSGTMIVVLDAAAPFAGDLPKRGDLCYFVTHPCHPSIFSGDGGSESRRDFFGGRSAVQNIICCLMQGPEEAYRRGEDIARVIYSPVGRSHRVTVEQFVILEPVLSETVAATCCMIMSEAMDEAVRRGVPVDAARDFILGHLNLELAIAFREMPDGRFSDGCLKSIDNGKEMVFRSDWKRVFDPSEVARSIEEITKAGQNAPTSK
jgi:hypothetical protein